MNSDKDFQEAINNFIQECPGDKYGYSIEFEGGYGEAQIYTYVNEDEGIYFDFDNFKEFANEVISMEISDDESSFDTLTKSIYCLEIEQDEFEFRYGDLEYKIEFKDEVISVSSSSENIFYDFGLIKFTRVFDKDFYPSCAKPLIVFSYPNPKIKSEFKDQEAQYLESFMLELIDNLELQYLAKSKIPLIREIDSPYYDEGLDSEEYNQKDNNTISSLEKYNEGVSLYLSAIQINDHEMRYLGFYKILEHFSSSATKQEYFQKMIARLNTYNSKVQVKSDYIQSIFDLADTKKEYNTKDKNYLIPLLKELDLESFITLLPDKLTKHLSKSKTIEVTPSSNLLNIADESKFYAALMKELYETRNYVAHAKSNISKGTPLINSKDDIKTINKFMNSLSRAAITWYNQLPEQYQ